MNTPESVINLHAYQVWIGDCAPAIVHPGIGLIRHLDKTFLYPELQPEADIGKACFTTRHSDQLKHLNFQIDPLLDAPPEVLGNRLYLASLAVQAVANDQRGFRLHSAKEIPEQMLAEPRVEALAQVALVAIITKSSILGSVDLATHLKTPYKRVEDARKSFVSLLILTEQDAARVSSGNSPLHEITYNARTGVAVRLEEDNGDSSGDREPLVPVLPSGSATTQVKRPE